MLFISAAESSSPATSKLNVRAKESSVAYMSEIQSKSSSSKENTNSIGAFKTSAIGSTATAGSRTRTGSKLGVLVLDSKDIVAVAIASSAKVITK